VLKAQNTAEKTKSCNAGEDRVTKRCTEYMRNDWDVKKSVKDLKALEIRAAEVHRLTQADFCVDKVVFGWDDTPPQPRDNKWQCPKYSCNLTAIKDNTTCLKTVNPFNEFGTDAVVYLKTGVCKNGQVCNVGANQLYQNWTSSVGCVSIDKKPDEKKTVYPGEACKTQYDCYNSNYTDRKTKEAMQHRWETGFCIDGICSGQKEGGYCNITQECWVGTFCNGLRCEKQQPERGFCIDSTYCLNNLLCLNNTCAQMYSQKNGTFLSKDFNDKNLCEMGATDPDTNQCAQLRYLPAFNTTPDAEGFVKCNLGDKCNYTTGFYDENGKLKKFTQDCGCGYNAEGQGYCPLPHDTKTDAWRSYYKTKAKAFANKCHTLNRGNCNEQIPDALQKEVASADRRSQNAHMYKAAVPCAEQVMSSAFAKASIMSIVMVLLALLF